jgi:hypothetical protein
MALGAIHYIYKARRCLLERRFDMAGYYLGQALHYIQDRCVESRSSRITGRLRLRPGSSGCRRTRSRWG